jgi:hypothetical protein
MKIKGCESKRSKKNIKFLIISYVTTPGNGTIVQVINLEFISGIRVYYEKQPTKGRRRWI